MKPTLYECGICFCLHPWEFHGDCTQDAERVGSVRTYAKLHQMPVEDIVVRSWKDRQLADEAEHEA